MNDRNKTVPKVLNGTFEGNNYMNTLELPPTYSISLITKIPIAKRWIYNKELQVLFLQPFLGNFNPNCFCARMLDMEYNLICNLRHGNHCCSSENKIVFSPI